MPITLIPKDTKNLSVMDRTAKNKYADVNFLPKNFHTFHRKIFLLFPELIIFASEKK